ncbi:MAG: S8 family serine peptidase [Actinomycetota bacterium]|nr:S8 family serine peptidase [Actinomycetota bacterium]
MTAAAIVSGCGGGSGSDDTEKAGPAPSTAPSTGGPASPALTGPLGPASPAPTGPLGPEVPATLTGAPNDPLFAKQWHLQAVGVPEAWAVATGKDVTVALLDTGVAYEDNGDYRRAPDLAGTRFVAGWDFVDDDEHPNDEPVPGRPSHGTHMAGSIAQTTGNGLGGAGVAPGAAIMPIRVLSPDGGGTNENIAAGLRFAADHGADVANLSLGSREPSPVVDEAVRYALGNGVTVISSVGEDSGPAATYPAAYPGVISVGAVRLDKTLAPYSSYGPRLDVVAPGGQRSSDQNGDGLEDGIIQQALQDQMNSFCFCFIEGTSSAAAHVSGAAALVIASGRAETPTEVREVLMSTADDLGQPGRDDTYGAGLINAARAVGAPTAR